MTQPSPSYERFLNDRYELAGRVIDPVAGTLTRGGKLSQLRRKQLEVLAILVSADGKLVLRSSLIEQAWA